jgi:hypothetical protein
VGGVFRAVLVLVLVFGSVDDEDDDEEVDEGGRLGEQRQAGRGGKAEGNAVPPEDVQGVVL